MTYSEFTKLADILNESVLADKRFGQALDKCVSCSMLFGFWKDVVGKRFEKVSIPYDLKGTVLFVSVMSSVVVQELSMYKAELLKKIEPYADGLNFKITDIRFDYKNWQSVKNNIEEISGGKTKSGSKAFDIDVPEYYTEQDYETIGLDNNEEDEFEKLRESFAQHEFLPEGLREKILKSAMTGYKAKKLRDKEKEEKSKD